MWSWSVDLKGMKAMVAGLQALDKGLTTELTKTMKVQEEKVRASTAWKDRTGALRRSAASGVNGSFLRGSMEAWVGLYAAHAPFIEYGTRRHVIYARNAKALRWIDESGGLHFSKKVFHPGIRARKPVRTAFSLAQIQYAVSRALRDAMLGKGA